MDKLELAAGCFLHSIKGLGNKTLWKIKEHWGSFQKCLESDSKALYSSPLSAAIAESIINSRQDTDYLAFLEKLSAENISICSIEDSNYPYLLANIYDPPYLFYYKGNINILSDFCFAIVGSRAATAYGKHQARRFAQDLSKENIIIISGMARGIDSEAHRGVLDADGRTVAVLGSGLDIIYPPENRPLYNDICAKGLVISEFPIHTSPEPGNFPARNRTISGLSRGVLVVEAKLKSGALITADFALEQGREVFAIPGPVSSKNSEGTNALIKQGAQLVSSVDDILESYSLKIKVPEHGHIEQNDLFSVEPEEALIIDCMGFDPVCFDELLRNAAISIGKLSTVLLKMELKGIIKAMPGNYYVKI